MSGSAWFTIAGSVCLVIGLLFTLIGFASPYWASYETGTDGESGYRYYYQGLWQFCSQVDTADKNCDDTLDSDNPNWYEACQALSILGFLGTLLGTILLICWACTYRLSSLMKIVIVITLLISFVFLAVTCIVYRAEFFDVDHGAIDYDLDWSFYLMVVGCIFVALSVGFIIPAGPSYYGQQKYPYGFPFGMQMMFGGRGGGFYGDPGYGRMSRPVYGRGRGYGGGAYGGDSGVYGGRGGGDYTGFYEREPYRKGGLGAYDPYSRRGRW